MAAIDLTPWTLTLIRMQVLDKKNERLFSKTFYSVNKAEIESNKVKSYSSN